MPRRQSRFGRLTALGLLCAMALGVGLAVPGCSPPADDWPKDRTGPKVVVSFAPLYCFAVNVAGEDAVVRNLLTSSGPHHFQPTDRDARLLQRADLFLVNGIGLEGDKPANMKEGSGNKNLKIIELGSRIPEDKLLPGSCTHTDHAHHDHEHGMDPHVWLSPDYAVMMVEGIRDELKQADPAHAAGYDDRAAKYIARLHKLKEEGIEMLRDKKNRKIVTFHDSMTYFARTFDLKIAGVVQKNPGTEPNDQELRRLIALCSDPNDPIRVICVEPQYSTSNAGEVLKQELKRNNVPDPALVELDPLETVQPGELNAEWYENKMLQNLRNLAEAMR